MVHYWLIMFWQAGLDSSVEDWGPEEVKAASEWPGKAETFFDALLKCGFTERTLEGGLCIHEWHDYAGELLARRRKENDRSRARRNAKARSFDRGLSAVDHRSSAVEGRLVQFSSDQIRSEIKKIPEICKSGIATSMPANPPPHEFLYIPESGKEGEEKDSKEPVICPAFNATDLRASMAAPPQVPQDRRTDAGVTLDPGKPLASIVELPAKREPHMASEAQSTTTPGGCDAETTTPPQSTDATQSPAQPTTADELLAMPYRNQPLARYLRGCGLYQDHEVAMAAVAVMTRRNAMPAEERALCPDIVGDVKRALQSYRTRQAPAAGTLLRDTPALRVISAIGGLL